MKKHVVSLTSTERQFLQKFITTGTHKAREIIRARILLLSAAGKTDQAIATTLGCSTDTARAMRQRCDQRPTLSAALTDAPRSGQPPKLQPHHEAFIIATACTEESPPGHAHWEPSGLQEALKAAYDDIQDVSNETIRRLLVRHKLKPWREKNVVHPKALARVQRTDGRSTHPLH